MKPEYKVITEINAIKFAQDVTNNMSKGWMLYGPPFSVTIHNNAVYAQAMIFEEQVSAPQEVIQQQATREAAKELEKYPSIVEIQGEMAAPKPVKVPEEVKAPMKKEKAGAFNGN